MKKQKKISEKEKFLKMFQNVNKIKLNEDFWGSNVDDNIVKTVMEQMKNGTLTIKNAETQTNNDLTFIVLTGSDSDNNISKLTFKVSSQAGDQEGTFNLNNIELKEFSYQKNDGSESINLNEDDLKEINAQYGSEFFDIIDKYVDIQSDEEVTDEIYEETIKKIDSYPFGGGRDNMQTSKAYADEKPVNPDVRVKASELEKFVSEDMNSILHYSQAARDKGSSFKTKLAVSYQYVLMETLQDIGVKILNIEDVDNKTYKLTVEYNDQTRDLIINNEKFNNAAKVRELIKRALKIGITETMQTSKAYADEKPVNPDVRVKASELEKFVSETGEYSDEDLANLNVVRFDKATEPEEPEEFNNEPLPELSEKKKQEILNAYDTIIQRSGDPNYAPTIDEVMAEINKSEPQKVEKTRTYPAIAEPFLESDVDEMAFLRNINKISPEKYKGVFVHLWDSLTVGVKIAVFLPKDGDWALRQPKGIIFVAQEVLDRPDIAYLQGQAAKEFLKQHGYKINNENKLLVKIGGNTSTANMDEDKKKDTYPDPIGREFDPNQDYPEKKKKHRKKIKLGEYGNIPESTDQDKYENVVFLQGDEAFQPLEILDSKGKDAALEYLKQWHYPGEHEGMQELGHGTGDKVYEKDGYIMSWNPYIGYIGLQYDLSHDLKEGTFKNLATAGLIGAAGLGLGGRVAAQQPFQKLGDKVKSGIENVKGDVKQGIGNIKDKGKTFFMNDKSRQQPSGSNETFEQLQERMSKLDGFGEGRSRDENFAKQIAINQGRTNLLQKKTGNVNGFSSGTISNSRIDEIYEFQEKDGTYIFLVNITGDVQSNVKEQKIKSEPKNNNYDLSQLTEEEYGDEDIAGLSNVPTGWGAKKVAKHDISQDFEKSGDVSSKKHPLPYDTDFQFTEDEEKSLSPEQNQDVPDDKQSEPQNDQIAQLAKDKEEAGEKIEGGLGDGKSPLEFDPDQILKGMEVEMEHTIDPLIALEITMDHLSENNRYYSVEDSPEDSAQVGAAKDAEEKTKDNFTKSDTKMDSSEISQQTTSSAEDDDKEMTNMLLGFKPKNVGDGVDENIETEEPPEWVMKQIDANPEKKDEILNQYYTSLNKPMRESEESSEKFSTMQKNIHGMTYLFAFPDERGIETKEGLNGWESKDRGNREVQFVNSRENAVNALKGII